MKNIYLIFVIQLFLFSCQKEYDEPVIISLGSPSDPCDLDCSEWEQCATQLINPNDWWGPTRWICESVFQIYYHRTFMSTQTITNDSVSSSTTHTTMYVKNIYDENKVTLLIYQDWNDRYELILQFLNPNSGFFNVLPQSVHNPVLDEIIFYEGNGSFIKNGSSPSYTLELNLIYQYNNKDYNMNVIGSD